MQDDKLVVILFLVARVYHFGSHGSDRKGQKHCTLQEMH